MNRRMLATLLITTFAMPASAAAQLTPAYREPGVRPKVHVSPFIGYLVPLTRTEEWGFDTGSTTFHTDAESALESGIAGGVNIEVPIIGALGILAGGGYGQRGDTRVTVQDGVDVFRLDGNSIVFGRLAAALRLRQDGDIVVRRVGATLYAGGVAMRERPRLTLGSLDYQEEATHYAVNLGLSVDVPVHRNRISLQLAAEDYIIWWDEDALANVPYEYFDRPGESRDQTSVIAQRSHAFMLRVGVSFHLW